MAQTAPKEPPVIASRRIPGLRTTVLVGLLVALGVSLGFNVWLKTQQDWYFAEAAGISERYHSGDRTATDRILLLKVRGTIMPPFTARIIRSIEQAQKDERVKGIVLSIDSPGGLVADSHQIYHRLQELRETKPVFVSMKRIAASGGLYIAMGGGPKSQIFAEPTAWTGSIGVIIPRFDASTLADKLGFQTDSLKTGPLKDSLNPFRPLSDSDREVWGEILAESFDRFKGVIADNRPGLSDDDVARLATGQIYTANQALEEQLIDRIGFEVDAIEALQKQLALESVRIVTYHSDPGWLDLVLDQLQARSDNRDYHRLMEATVPKAMYYCSWAPSLH